MRAPIGPKLRLAIRVMLVLWSAASMTVTAAVGYKLWWQRDRVLYSGKDERAQRIQVIRRAGLNPRVIGLAATALVTWPDNVDYTAEGDPNALSYIKYLLAPRIPSGGSNYVFKVDDGKVLVTSGKETNPLGDQNGDLRALLGVLASFALVGGIGFFFHNIARIRGLSVPEKFAVGILIVCILATASKAVFGVTSPAFTLCAVFGLIGLLLKAREILRPAGDGRPRTFERPDGIVLIMMAAVCAAIAVSVLLSIVVGPDDWDAWAIWGPKAKVLAVGRGPLQGASFFGHPDYPLLWPSLWAFSGWCSGGWEDVWSRAWGPILLGLAAWQISIAVRRSGGSALISWAAAVAFATIPKALVVASWSYAEAPLWLAGSCLLGRLLSAERGSERKDFLLAGLFAAMAALTKNEGVVLIVLSAIWLLFINRSRVWLWYLVPVAVLYAPWMIWVRCVLALGSHSTEGISLSPERIAYAASRFVPVSARILHMWCDWRQWALVFPSTLLLLVAAMVVGERKHLYRLLFPVGVIAVSFLVILFHREGVAWQVDTSWDRLTLQVAPLAIMSLASLIPALRLGRTRSDSPDCS